VVFGSAGATGGYVGGVFEGDGYVAVFLEVEFGLAGFGAAES
jgi:hypothetical protein